MREDYKSTYQNSLKEKQVYYLPTGERIELPKTIDPANLWLGGLFWLDTTPNKKAYRFISKGVYGEAIKKFPRLFSPEERAMADVAFRNLGRKGKFARQRGFMFTTGGKKYISTLRSISDKLEQAGYKSVFKTERSEKLTDLIDEWKKQHTNPKDIYNEIQSYFWRINKNPKYLPQLKELYPGGMATDYIEGNKEDMGNKSKLQELNKPQTQGDTEMAKKKSASKPGISGVYADTPLGRSVKELDERIARGDWEKLPDGRVKIATPGGGSMTLSEEDARRMQENQSRGSTMVGFNGGLAFLTGETEDRMLKDPKFREHVNSLLEKTFRDVANQQVEGWGWIPYKGTKIWGRKNQSLSELPPDAISKWLQRNKGMSGEQARRLANLISGAGAAGGGAGAAGRTSPEEAFQRQQGQQQAQQIGNELGRDISDLQRQIQQMAGERKDLIPQGEQLWGMTQPGLQSLSSYYNQLMQGRYAETPEGRAEQSKAMRSLNFAKDRIRKLYAQRGLTGSAAEQEALAKADIATGQTLATLPVAGRQQAMQYFGKMASVIPGYKPSGLQASQLSSLVGLASILSGRERTAAGLASQLGLGSAKTKV